MVTRLAPGPNAYQRRTPAKISTSSPNGPISTRSTIATRTIKRAIPRLIVCAMVVHCSSHPRRWDERSLNSIQGAPSLSSAGSGPGGTARRREARAARGPLRRTRFPEGCSDDHESQENERYDNDDRKDDPTDHGSTFRPPSELRRG